MMRRPPLFAWSGLIVSVGEMIGSGTAKQPTLTHSHGEQMMRSGTQSEKGVLGRLMSLSSFGAKRPDALLCLLAGFLAPVSRYKQQP